jgi:hypothetical protein
MNGGVAQLGEHLVCNQEVVGSIPIASTILRARFGPWTVGGAGRSASLPREIKCFAPGDRGALFVIVKMFDPQSAGAMLGEADCILFFDCGPSAEGLPLRMTGFANQAQ